MRSRNHLCRRVNADGAAVWLPLARQEIGLVTFSSDLVFDGNHAAPGDAVAPLNVYGHSKAMAEKWVLATHPCSLVIRTSAFFGPWDEYNCDRSTLASGHSFVAADDTVVSPTFDLVNATLDLLIDGGTVCGIWRIQGDRADLAPPLHSSGLVPTQLSLVRQQYWFGCSTRQPPRCSEQ